MKRIISSCHAELGFYLTTNSVQPSESPDKDHGHEEPSVTLHAPPVCSSSQPYRTNEHTMCVGGLTRYARWFSISLSVLSYFLTRLRVWTKTVCWRATHNTVAVLPDSPAHLRLTQDTTWLPLTPCQPFLVYPSTSPAEGGQRYNPHCRAVSHVFTPTLFSRS